MQRFFFILVSLVAAAGLIAFTPEQIEELGLGDAGNGVATSPTRETREIPPEGLILIPDSTTDCIMSFDPDTGDLLDAAFITLDPNNSGTPIEIVMHPDGTRLLVSDQTADCVHQYDLDGNYIGLFAPAGGVNPDILNNVRGMYVRMDDAHIFVTVASGANANAIAEFDGEGNYLGNFVPVGGGGLDSPWDVNYREDVGDFLVNGSDCDQLHRYDASGAWIADLCSLPGMFEQMFICPSGTILGSNFSATGAYEAGVHEFAADGAHLGYYGPPAGGSFRGVYELPGGNILCSNSGGVYETDRTGALLDIKITGVSARFISFVQPINLLPAPQNLVSTIQNDTVALTWEAPDTTRLVLLNYNLYRDDAVIANLSPDVLDYLDANLSWGTYVYHVTAVWDEGESFPSNQVTVEIIEPLNPPANLTATLLGRDVTLDWDSPQNSRSLLGYLLYRNGISHVQIDDPDLTEYTDTGLNSGQYLYWVMALYTGGQSDPGNIAAVTVPDYTPPINLVTSVIENDVTLEWDPPANDLNVTGYNIYRNALLIAELDAAIDSYIEADLPEGSHSYTMTAVYDEVVESSHSDAVVAEVVFQAPMNLEASVDGNDVHLTWDVPVRSVTGYWVYRDNEQLVNGYANEYTDMDVPAGVHEYYVTTIYSDEWESGPSNTVEVNITALDDGALVPAVTTIEGNYPNPFNPDTEVRFGLSSPGPALLEVYNLLGQRVITLADGHHEAGWHRVIWHGLDHESRPVSSGVYLLRLRTEGTDQVHRAVMLK
ncbi:MAG: T9SS type A sorting domain-containing protein [Candidatus Cloacimonetes bacterium]|nr:T9SS type A sorting domain-containing protein [Candidatus Cloacimonadota bacterium]